jgi:hypothetical protein
MLRLFAAITFAFLCTCSAFADPAPTTQPVQLTVEPPIVSDNNCLVQRFHVDIAKGAPDGFITSEWVATERDGCLYPSAKDQPQTVTITVVAMVGRRDCVVHMNYAMVSASRAFEGVKNAKIKDFIHLDAQSGPHALEEKIRLGDYDGQPLFITISPKAYLKANPQGTE